MQKLAKYWPATLVTALCALAMPVRADAPPPHLASDEDVEVAFLIHRNTADSLATASLLAHLTESSEGGGVAHDPPQLIQRAVTRAPERPELLWLELRDCQQRHCADEIGIANRLKKLDAENGLAWLPDLKVAVIAMAASSNSSTAANTPNSSTDAVTQVLVRMGAATRPSLYWNKLTVMMFDSLTHGSQPPAATAITRDADDRLMHVMGVLSAANLSTLPLLRQVCGSDQFGSHGRRAACETLMTRLETADAVLLQNLSVVLQQSWWPAGSPEYNALRMKHSQQRYLMIAAGRTRVHADQVARMRIEDTRHAEREEDVERAVLAQFHEPLERPADWRSPSGVE